MERMSDRRKREALRVFHAVEVNPAAWTVSKRHGIPGRIWETIQDAYIAPLRAFGERTGIYLVPSAGSCYRPPEHEIARGRSGLSQHTFSKGAPLGACDLVRADGGSMAEAVPEICRSAPFRRIAWYPANGFVHVDYRITPGISPDVRRFFHCASPSSAWVFVRTLPKIEHNESKG